MKINIKRLLIDSLIAGLIISIGLMVSRTFFCGMFCGMIYWFITDFKGDICMPIAQQLNHPTDSQIPALCQLGHLRGGNKNTIGGIFWADIEELTDPLHGFTQIVGHNRVKEITEYNGTHNNKIIFCDCLWNNNYLYLE